MVTEVYAGMIGAGRRTNVFHANLTDYARWECGSEDVVPWLIRQAGAGRPRERVSLLVWLSRLLRSRAARLASARTAIPAVDNRAR